MEGGLPSGKYQKGYVEAGEEWGRYHMVDASSTHLLSPCWRSPLVAPRFLVLGCSEGTVSRGQPPGAQSWQRKAENRSGNMEEEDQGWIASPLLSVLHSDTHVLVLKP